MSLPRFYHEPLRPGELTLEPAEARHAAGARRLGAGDQVELFDGQGQVAIATLLPTEARRARSGALRVLVSEVSRAPPPSAQLTLIVAACKGPRLTWMVEKCTELGVARILLADFERSVVRVGEAHLDKLRRTAIEACKQCRRAWLPELAGAGPWSGPWTAVPACQAEPWTAGAPAGQADPWTAGAPARQTQEWTAGALACFSQPLIVATPDPQARPLGQCLRMAAQGRETSASSAAPGGGSPWGVRVVVGPEGGLSERELERLRAVGAIPARLSPNILRVETAAICVAAAWSEVLLGAS